MSPHDNVLVPWQLIDEMRREVIARIDAVAGEFRAASQALDKRLTVLETQHRSNHTSTGTAASGAELGRAVAAALHDSGPLGKDAITAKPPEQQLDAAARVLGLPVWKALLYALLIGAAMAGGGKSASSIIDLLRAPATPAAVPTDAGR